MHIRPRERNHRKGIPLSIESVGTDDMVVVDPFKVITVFTGVYTLTGIFTGTPDTTVYFPFCVGAAEVSVKKKILVLQE